MSPRSNKKNPALGQREKQHVISMSCRLEPAIWSRDTGQQIPCFDRCQLIITWMSNIKEVPVNQDCMSLSTYYLEYGRHLARLRRRRRRRRAYAPTSNAACHFYHEKRVAWVSISMHACDPFPISMGLRLAALWAAGAPL